MLRILFIAMLLMGFYVPASAKHIKGGWVRYEYVNSPTSTTTTYRITVNVFKNCNEAGPMPTSLVIYDGASYSVIQTISGIGNSFVLISTPVKTTFNPCLNNPPTICYQVYQYTTTVTLTNNTAGYIIASQDAYRISGIVNLVASSSTGITFSAQIPGVIQSTDYHINSNPNFKFTDTVIICYDSYFEYQFQADDADKDSLSYAFGNGINSSNSTTPPPFSPINYSSGYTGSQPLGKNVSINPTTGLISGRSPSTVGEYVVAVYVSEWRKGVLINTTRKELQITVSNCSLSAATLEPAYLNCDSFSFVFRNASANGTLNSFYWDFGDKKTSTLEIAPHTYADTGTYNLKLKVANSSGCQDSATSIVKVYPGFTADLEAIGSCYLTPFQFNDKTIAKYGKVIRWIWDFGDTSLSTDTSTFKNPTYLFSAPGSYIVDLQVESNYGCKDTISKTIVATGKPWYHLPFSDTLICSIDSLPLKIQTTATDIKWQATTNMIGANTVSPIVFPKDTTIYTVIIKESGCSDTAQVKVNVLPFIKVDFSANPYLCSGDSVVLRPISDALSYRWREKGGGQTLSDTATKNPYAFPTKTTTYYVAANLGYCQDNDSVTVLVAPYPTVRLAADSTICYGDGYQMIANIKADKFYWASAPGLSNTSVLNPIVYPTKTTTYRLYGYDTSYCRKMVSDDITISIIPAIKINAGRDTSVVIGQPLQLNALSNNSTTAFIWSPTTGLSDPYIHNPIGLYTAADPEIIKYIVTGKTPEGCVGKDDIIVNVFKMAPDIIVPSAFTPNHDGLNDLARPILKHC